MCTYQTTTVSPVCLSVLLQLPPSCVAPSLSAFFLIKMPEIFLHILFNVCVEVVELNFAQQVTQLWNLDSVVCVWVILC